MLYLTFYFVVASLCGNYLYEAITNAYIGKGAEELSMHFKTIISNESRMTIFVLLQVIVADIVLWFGVDKGLERLSKILMPMLLILMVVMNFDFSKITPRAIMMAVGQCFFSLSVGAGMMVIFGAYMPKRQNIATTSIMVVVLDTLVALLAGFIIFPAVFAFGFSPSEGPQLVYVVLPTVFQKMSFTWLCGVMFFLLLFIAAMTSTVAILEVLVANSIEASHNKLKRRNAIIISSAITFILSELCVLSLSGKWGEFKIAGNDMFKCLDLLITAFMLPIGALCMSQFVGWFMPKQNKKSFWQSAFIFILRWIVPIALIFILLNGFGLLDGLFN